MKRLSELVAASENWLIARVLHYAKEHGYVRYTSTLEEAWRLSIAGLSKSLLSALEAGEGPPELSPEDDFRRDPIAAFGLTEAQKHRARGISLGMFLGLMKYYRQCYVDLIREAGFAREYEEQARLFVDRFFDRVELGFTVEWAESTAGKLIDELQARNRSMTNEKNRYLTIFESLADPVILFDAENRVVNVNFAAAQLFGYSNSPGGAYYGETQTVLAHPWLLEDVVAFSTGNEPERMSEKDFIDAGGKRHFEIKLKRMLDVSEKFQGTVVILNDLTERQRAEAEREHLISELQDAMAKVKTLSGLLPICCGCKKIRDDRGNWNQLESYLLERSNAKFSHSVCPACAKVLYPDMDLTPIADEQTLSNGSRQE